MGRNLLEILRFLLAGGSCLLLELGALYALTEAAGLHYLYSAALAFTLSVIVNYLMCRYWVFQGAGQQSAKAAAVFIGSSLAGLGLNQLCMWLFVEMAGLWYMAAKLLAAVVVTAWNYVLKRYALTRL